MYKEQDQMAWSLYWSEDRLRSCVAQSAEADQQVLDELWIRFAETLDDGNKVLDLATGNGVVAKTILSVNAGLEIDAVDKASIDPLRYLHDKENLRSIRFCADTDLLSMPYERNSFDALTSQFGIEYAGFSEASLSVIRYLKEGGHFQYVVHHSESDIIRSSKRKIIELGQLTRDDGLLDTLMKVLRGEAAFNELERMWVEYLEQDNIRTLAISGQVSEGIERIAANYSARPKECIELGASMGLRIRSELTRLRQLILAGQSEVEMALWLESATAMKARDLELEEIYIDPSNKEYLIGWLVKGLRA